MPVSSLKVTASEAWPLVFERVAQSLLATFQNSPSEQGSEDTFDNRLNGTRAIFTAILFNFVKHLIGLSLAYSSVTSAYGAAGSLMALSSGSITRYWFLCSVLSMTKLDRYVRAGRRIAPVASF